MPKSKKPVKKFTFQFPNISRSITEFPVIQFVDRWIVLGFVAGVLIMLILLTAMDLRSSVLALEAIEKQQAQVAKEFRYWQRIVQKYNNYRDGYFKLALLSYQMGNIQEARAYLQKALQLDPNFEQGRDFERKLNG